MFSERLMNEASFSLPPCFSSKALGLLKIQNTYFKHYFISLDKKEIAFLFFYDRPLDFSKSDMKYWKAYHDIRLAYGGDRTHDVSDMNFLSWQLDQGTTRCCCIVVVIFVVVVEKTMIRSLKILHFQNPHKLSLP